MRQCNLALSRMTSRLQAEGFRARVIRTLQAWADWAVYPTEFLMHINDVFLGQDKVKYVETITFRFRKKTSYLN